MIVYVLFKEVSMKKFNEIPFKDCNINDHFFDSLKEDYNGFCDWFFKKALEGKKALVYKDKDNIKAFINLKYNEQETIQLADKTLQIENRIKISTLKLSDDIQGQRLGEGAIGYCLWEWQKNNSNQIYVTVFPKHKSLILLLSKFGFEQYGFKQNGEIVYIKDKRHINKTDPYKTFPYVINDYIARLLPIKDKYHDTLFTYSELLNTFQEADEIASANGITKIYIATPYSDINYTPGSLVFVYRKYTGDEKPGYKSVITSYCTIVKQTYIKRNYTLLYSFECFLKEVGNKSVYNNEQLSNIYNSNSRNIVLLEMVYNGYMGKGHNINWFTLKNNRLWGDDIYPYDLCFNQTQCKTIFKLGEKDVQNIIIN